MAESYPPTGPSLAQFDFHLHHQHPHLRAQRFFCQHRLQGSNIHRLLGDDVPQMSVFFFQLLHSPRFALALTRRALIPALEAGLGDPVPPAQFFSIHSHF